MNRILEIVERDRPRLGQAIDRLVDEDGGDPAVIEVVLPTSPPR